MLSDSLTDSFQLPKIGRIGLIVAILWILGLFFLLSWPDVGGACYQASIAPYSSPEVLDG